MDRRSLRIATWNLRGLQTAGFSPWPDFPPYSPAEFQAKLDFLEDRIRNARADVLGVQEVAEPAAFEALHQRLVDLYPHRALGVPGEGSGLRVGLLSRFPVEAEEIHEALPERGRIHLAPDLPAVRERFRRPVLAVTVTCEEHPLTLLVVHLKAKRPDLFADEPDDDPVVLGRAMGRSLVVRAADSAGLRAVLAEASAKKGGPVVLLGDFNDGLQSVTTRMLSAPLPGPEAPFRDGELYNLVVLQQARAPFLSLYTHVWQQRPEVLDHIVVSADLARRFQDLRIYNDFLEDADDDRALSDHGLVVARFSPAAPGA